MYTVYCNVDNLGLVLLIPGQVSHEIVHHTSFQPRRAQKDEWTSKPMIFSTTVGTP